MTGGLNGSICAKKRGGNHGILKSFKSHQWRQLLQHGVGQRGSKERARGGAGKGRWRGGGEMAGGAVVEVAGGEVGGGGRAGQPIGAVQPFKASAIFAV